MLNDTLFIEAANPRHWRRRLSNPLRLVAYLIWFAVVVSDLFDYPLAGWQTSQRLGAFANAMILLCLLGTGVANTSLRHRRWLVPLLVALQILATLTAIDCFPGGMQPALLVILAVQLIMFFPPRPACLMLLLVNLGFAAIGFLHWNRNGVLVYVLAFGSFQAFAALTVYYARRAERANAELLAANAQLLSTRSLLEESTRSQERLKLSRELHDVAGHKLTALKLNLQLLLRKPAFAGIEEVHSCKQLADELLEDIRAVVSELRKYDGVDLRAALLTLIAHLPGPQIHLSMAQDSLLADVQGAEVLLRCAQEGLTNALRHSQASEIWLELGCDAGQARLRVRDNGRGAADLHPGNGLTGMRERLLALGGDLQLHSVAGGGLTLDASIPLPA